MLSNRFRKYKNVEKSNLIVGLLITIMLVLLIVFIQSIKSSSTNNELSQTNLFERKKDCLQYESRVSNLINDKNEADENIRYWEIFYSPKVSSCLYVIVKTNVDQLGTTQYWTLNDVLTGQVLVSTIATLGNPTDNSDYFLNSLEDYKAKMNEFVETVKLFGGNGNYSE